MWFFLDASDLIDTGVHWENFCLLHMEEKGPFQEMESQRTTIRPENHSPEGVGVLKHATVNGYFSDQSVKAIKEN